MRLQEGFHSIVIYIPFDPPSKVHAKETSFSPFAQILRKFKFTLISLEMNYLPTVFQSCFARSANCFRQSKAMRMKQQRIQRRKTHPKKIITKCKLNARAALDLFFSCSFLSCNVKDGQMQTMAKFIIILDIAVVHFRQTYFAEFSC